MASGDHVKNIAVVGASGQVGSAALRSLLDCGTFNLTAISRHDSTAGFPPGVTVTKGDYSSSEFLEQALQNHDVLVITLGGRTPPDVQTKLIGAAAKAGVPWILTNEYGGDGDNEEFASMVSIIGDKKRYRDQIEELGKSSWIGICCNLWFDYGLRVGIWNIDIPNRKATLFDNGETPIVTTTIAQTGRAIARLLSLPVHSSSSPCLSDFKNRYCYVRSFSVTQRATLRQGRCIIRESLEDRCGGHEKSSMVGQVVDKDLTGGAPTPGYIHPSKKSIDGETSSDE